MIDKGEPYPYNPEKAKALMKEAGLENGVDIQIYALAGNADDTAEIAAIQQMWGAIGVRLKVLLVDSATRVAKYRADDFQMRTAAWTNDINDPSQIVSYHGLLSEPMSSNRSGFHDAELRSRSSRRARSRRTSTKRARALSAHPGDLCRRGPDGVPARVALRGRARQEGKASCSCRSATTCSSASIWSREPERRLSGAAGLRGAAARLPREPAPQANRPPPSTCSTSAFM